MVTAFTSRYDSPTSREENSKLLPTISFHAIRKDDDDDHAVPKSLVEGIEKITPVAASRDGGSESKSRIIVQTVAPEPWFFRAMSKLRYIYDFTDVVDMLHSSIRAVSSHEPSGAMSTRPLCGAPLILIEETGTANAGKVLYTGLKRYGETPSHRVHGAGYQSNMTRPPLHHGKRSGSTLTCFHCMMTACQVTTCPFPKNKERIKKNVEEWRQSRGFRNPVSQIHYGAMVLSGLTTE